MEPAACLTEANTVPKYI